MTGFGCIQKVAASNKSLEPRSQNSFEFGMTLALQLLRPFIEVRSLWGLSKSIQNKTEVTPKKGVRTSMNLSNWLCTLRELRRNVDV